MRCVACGNSIHPERLAILPDTTVCVSCTTVKKRLCVMVPSNGKCGMTPLFAGPSPAQEASPTESLGRIVGSHSVSHLTGGRNFLPPKREGD